MGLRTAFQALILFCKLLGPRLIKVLDLVLDGISSFMEKLSLEKDVIRKQIEKEKEAEKIRLEEQLKKEQMNVKASQLILDEAWKQRFNDVLSFIKSDQYDLVLKLTKALDNEEVNLILFNSRITDEYKALKIINIMKSSK